MKAALKLPLDLPLFALLAAVALCAPALAHAATADTGVSLSTTKIESRKASLLGGQKLDSNGAFTEDTALPLAGLSDLIRFDREGLPPLDFGGGVDAGTRPVLALLIGLIVGFGIGHLIAHDRNGFILFLIVDVAIIAVSSVLVFAVGLGWFGYIEAVGLLASHIFQGIDAYGQAGGEKLLMLTRENTMMLAETGSHGPPPTTASRLLAFSF